MASASAAVETPASPSSSRPARPLRTATMALLLVTALASALLAIALFPEARYAFEGDSPVDVGPLATAELTPASSGRYVRASVDLDGSPSFTFARPREGDRRIAVARSAPSDAREALANAGPRFVDFPVSSPLGAHFVPPRLVAGRLARVGELGLRHRGLSRHLEALSPGAATRGWVLVEGDEPRSVAWIAGLEALVLAFLGWNLAAVARIVRKLPARSG